MSHLVRLAAAMYSRALLITGRRAKLREVVGRTEPRGLTGA